MLLQELGEHEIQLLDRVLGLYRKPNSDHAEESRREIFDKYERIHQAYAERAITDDEALKRGLFIQWYALSEPSYLTGIADLNESAENKIISVLNDRIAAVTIDDELIWMLNYYFNWQWIFERLSSFNRFDNTIVNEQNNNLPSKIDRDEMEKRGQMGEYWNSLTQSSKG